VEYLHLEEKYLHNFFNFSDKKEVDTAKANIVQSTWDAVNRITTSFIDDGFYGSINDPTNGKWFALATERIQNLKQISSDLEAMLSEEIHHKNQSINSEFWLYLYLLSTPFY